MGLLRFLHFYCIRYFFPLSWMEKKITFCSQNLASPVMVVKDLIKINKISEVTNKSGCLQSIGHKAQTVRTVGKAGILLSSCPSWPRAGSASLQGTQGHPSERSGELSARSHCEEYLMHSCFYSFSYIRPSSVGWKQEVSHRLEMGTENNPGLLVQQYPKGYGFCHRQKQTPHFLIG